jgi:hypothetical protein
MHIPVLRQTAACCHGAAAFDKRRRGSLSMTLEHDPEKWIPVFRKDHAQIK